MSIDDAPDHAWQASAACASVDPDLWFPEQGADTRAAKRVCARCPVIAQCLAEHLYEREGVWGGLSERERRRARPGYRGAAA